MKPTEGLADTEAVAIKVLTESVAKVLLINSKQEALILTVGEYKERPDKSFKPDLPGGRVDPGESELIAVRRELIEEAGIAVDLGKFQLAYARTELFKLENKSVSKFLYIAYVDETPGVTISWEHSSYEWVPLDGITKKVEFRPFYEEAIEYCITAGLI